MNLPRRIFLLLAAALMVAAMAVVNVGPATAADCGPGCGHVPPPGVTTLDECKAFFSADGKLTKKEKKQCKVWF